MRHDVTRLERRLLTELGAGAAVSTVAGLVLWSAGRRSQRGAVAAFGLQSLGWAAVNAVIVVRGVRGLTRPPGAGEEVRRRLRRLRNLLALNAGLDVVYVAGGVAVARRTSRRGDGLAIVVQGLFLLWLDTRHARRFQAALAHPDRSEPVTSPAPRSTRSSRAGRP